MIKTLRYRIYTFRCGSSMQLSAGNSIKVTLPVSHNKATARVIVL